MRVGIVCPYSFEVPGGVQAHVVDLARALRSLGHQVEVLGPADDDTPVPEFVTPTGRAVGIPYNGSVARLSFGPVSFARVRRWIGEHEFDVLHLHEPTAPSLSMLALMLADGPIVATFHTSTPRSKMLSAFQVVLQPFLEKITARIAVSALARRVQVEHLGGDAVEIPNGVDVGFFADAEPLPGYPRPGGAVGFVGRFTEPRKGMPVLLEAFRALDDDVRLLIVGRGDEAELRKAAGRELAARMDFLGMVDDETKARALRSVDVYCAPNTGGESFGIILTEAMSAGTAVVASDLDAFRRVLDDGRAGVLTPVGEPAALAAALRDLLADPARRAGYVDAARQRVMTYDWSVVAGQVLRVYESAMAADPRRVGEA
ncbi:glycosyltransferase family 4 protein [Saccharothrix obliqua]|uniref:glycosyltransferase family 4 protein n=1 Tax=Saccharothrix obliqua TaxID=2861747 RepID=UPI001C5ED3FE|nr:glycosyltransferase family 4 protein [Saccharothrix obliqua]MBW4717586.1 glycosyltransferase family 4 protein [Saccharothrix obliqua]